jgi:hypothetical protein
MISLSTLGIPFWLMDNHKWALYVWESFKLQVQGDRFTLAHADYHWDGIYDFQCDPEQERKLLAADLGDLRIFIEEDEWIKYDSFIAPAVARGLFDTLHFYCLQHDVCDIGIDENVRNRVGVNQVIHNDLLPNLVRNRHRVCG